jgi:hypothetical protein
MTKLLHDADSQRYKKQLAEFMASVNPKPDEALLEKLREKYLKAREGAKSE